MDDAKLNCGKDSAQKVDATYLPLVCPAAADVRGCVKTFLSQFDGLNQNENRVPTQTSGR